MSSQVSIKKAAFINACGKYSKIILGILVNAVLARILSADDYGIVAIITVFSTLFATLSDMGFSAAIIQNKSLSKDDIDNIYSFTVYISFVLMALFGLLSYPIANFYKNDVYISLGLILSISLLFNSLNMVPNGILNREKKFVSIAIRTIIVYLIVSVITIILAWAGLKYYALAIEAVLTAFFTFIWNYSTTLPRFKLRFDFYSIQKVLNYSGYQFAFNLINYFSRNLDNLLTGKFMGSKDLGFYNKAYTLMLYPVNNLTGVVAPVLHPILSDYNKLDIIYKKYVKIVKLLFCISLFVSPFCYLGAPEIIGIMYGGNWLRSVICFQILSIAIIPQMINTSAGAVFQAIGNTKLLFINSCINTGITVIAILIGVFAGKSIENLALCIAIAYICHFFTAYIMLIKYGFGFSFFEFVKNFFKELIILSIMMLAIVVYPFNITNIFISIILKFSYLAVVYLISLIATGEYKVIYGIVRRKGSKENVK